MLQTLFHQRPGQHRVALGKFLIMNSVGGRILQHESWDHSVKAGDQLDMSMVLDGDFATGEFCPFPSCRASRASLLGGEVSNGGTTCSKCCRWVLPIRIQGPIPVSPPAATFEGSESHDESSEWTTDSDEHTPDRNHQSSKQNIVEDVELYRKVNIVRFHRTEVELGCWREAMRADDIVERLERSRNILQPEFYDQISRVFIEVQSTNRLLLDLYDLFPIYQSRVPIITYYLELILPSLCRTLMDMEIFLDNVNDNLMARTQWVLMSNRFKEQGGVLLAPHFVMYVEMLVYVVRLLSR